MDSNQTRKIYPLEFMVGKMGHIEIRVYAATGRLLKKRTLRIAGKLRLWLIAAHKTLQVIYTAKEESNGYAARAEVTLYGVEKDDAFSLFSSWVRKFSPLETRVYIVEKKPI